MAFNDTTQANTIAKTSSLRIVPPREVRTCDFYEIILGAKYDVNNRAVKAAIDGAVSRVVPQWVEPCTTPLLEQEGTASLASRGGRQVQAEN